MAEKLKLQLMDWWVIWFSGYYKIICLKAKWFLTTNTGLSRYIECDLYLADRRGLYCRFVQAVWSLLKVLIGSFESASRDAIPT